MMLFSLRGYANRNGSFGIASLMVRDLKGFVSYTQPLSLFRGISSYRKSGEFHVTDC